MSVPPKTRPDGRSVSATLLGALAGLVAGLALSLVAVFGGMLTVLPNSSHPTPAVCRNNILLGIGFSVAALVVAGAAWYLLLHTRKALGWWVTFARNAALMTAIVLLAPWPCSLIGGATIAFMACR